MATSEPARMAHAAPDDLPLPNLHRREKGTPMTDQPTPHADRDHSEPPVVKRTCSQCGQPFSERACGLTHALAASERLADARTSQGAPEPSQTATEAHGDDHEWDYNEHAILREPIYMQPITTKSFVDTDMYAEAAEPALATLRIDLAYAERRAGEIEDRAEAAEAKVARVQRITDEINAIEESAAYCSDAGLVSAWRVVAKLRAVLDGGA